MGDRAVSRIHGSVTLDRVLELHEEHSDEFPGLCLSCGEDARGVEPDAERYRCDFCGERSVYGVEQIAILGAYREKGAPMKETPRRGKEGSSPPGM